MTTATITNPITTAINILEKDGWTTGAYRCAAGSRCAIGAVRAAYGIFENDIHFKLKDELTLEQWGFIEDASQDVDQEITEFEWFDEEKDEYELLDISAITEPVSAELLAEYTDIVLLLADTVKPGWDTKMVQVGNAARKRFSTVPGWTQDMIDRSFPRLTKKKVRTRDAAEGIVISFNDSELNYLDQEGRDIVIAKFREAAEKLNA